MACSATRTGPVAAGCTSARKGPTACRGCPDCSIPEARAYFEAIEAAVRPGRHQPDAGPDDARRPQPRPTLPRRVEARPGTAIASGGLGVHRGHPVTVVVTTTLAELNQRPAPRWTHRSDAGAARTGGGSRLPMRDLIGMAASAIHYLAVFDDHTERPLYLGRQKRIASADQRLICYARDRGCTRPNCLESGYCCEVHHSADMDARRTHRRRQAASSHAAPITAWQVAANPARRHRKRTTGLDRRNRATGNQPRPITPTNSFAETPTHQVGSATMEIMCGRFAVTTDPAALAEKIEAINEARAAESTGPNYNVAPTTTITTVVRRHDEPDDEPTRRVRPMRWGLIPPWAKAGSDGAPESKGPLLINARAEKVTTSPAFRSSAKSKRCLVPMDGYYEWRANADTDSGKKARKTPFFLHRADGELLFMAGLWSVWKSAKDATPLLSCTIITTDAVGELAEIHDRMPLIVPERDWDRWLDPDAPADLDFLAAPPSVDGIEMREISTLVNSVRNNGPELLRAGRAAARTSHAALVVGRQQRVRETTLSVSDDSRRATELACEGEEMPVHIHFR